MCKEQNHRRERGCVKNKTVGKREREKHIYKEREKKREKREKKREKR